MAASGQKIFPAVLVHKTYRSCGSENIQEVLGQDTPQSQEKFRRFSSGNIREVKEKQVRLSRPEDAEAAIKICVMCFSIVNILLTSSTFLFVLYKAPLFFLVRLKILTLKGLPQERTI